MTWQRFILKQVIKMTYEKPDLVKMADINVPKYSLDYLLVLKVMLLVTIFLKETFMKGIHSFLLLRR